MIPVPQHTEGLPGPGAVAATSRSDARRNRDAVLRAAGDLLAHNGLATGMAEVAAAAGVGIGTVYRHFPSKQHLLGALISQLFALATAQVEELSHDAGTAFQRLERAVRLGADTVATHPLTRLVAQGAGAGAWQLAASARERFDRAYQPLVDAARREGTLRPDVDAEDIGMLMAAACAVADDTRPERSRHLLDIAVDGLRAR